MFGLTYDPAVTEGILFFFGIGLIFIANFIKEKMGLAGKQAVVLTIAIAGAGTAVYLIVWGMLTLMAWFIYTLAVVGTMTGWYKLVWPKKKAD